MINVYSLLFLLKIEFHEKVKLLCVSNNEIARLSNFADTTFR